MTIHTITAVQNNGTFDSQYGTMYKQEATLDDGTTGEVSAKTEGKWKVGDKVEVQRTHSQYGTRFRFSIPKEEGAPGAPSSGKYQQDPETQSRIEASWAIGQAVAMGAKSHEELVAYGLKLLDARNALIAEIKAQPAAPVSKPLY
jgi:hypothetical protein